MKKILCILFLLLTLILIIISAIAALDNFNKYEDKQKYSIHLIKDTNNSYNNNFIKQILS